MRLMEKYFDDLSVGDSETTHRRTVTEADVTMWCMFTGDWFPIHCDKVYAEASMFKQRVAPGLMVVAMTGGLVVPPNPDRDCKLRHRPASLSEPDLYRGHDQCGEHCRFPEAAG